MEKQGWRVQLGMENAHGCASERDRASRLKGSLEKAAGATSYMTSLGFISLPETIERRSAQTKHSSMGRGFFSGFLGYNSKAINLSIGFSLYT